MNKNSFFLLSSEQQAMVLNQASPKIGLPPQAIEKDVWVSTILQLVFTMPFADKLIFKGGTSLSKVWGVINRFSEDIDLAVDRSLYNLDGALTKKEIKKLRKASSIFVREQFAAELQTKIEEYGLAELCTIEVEPDGEGDRTYPEPRKIFIRYKSALADVADYLKPVVMLEIGSRSLFEPNEKCHIQSMLEQQLPYEVHGVRAERKSRHLYDLYRMMNMDFAVKATSDDLLWESIRHHREIFTSVRGMNYAPDVRKRMLLVPRPDIIDVWKSDYEAMMETMIYGDKPSFDALISSMAELQERFRNNCS